MAQQETVRQVTSLTQAFQSTVEHQEQQLQAHFEKILVERGVYPTE
jgi:hypothetical protein